MPRSLYPLWLYSPLPLYIPRSLYRLWLYSMYCL